MKKTILSLGAIMIATTLFISCKNETANSSTSSSDTSKNTSKVSDSANTTTKPIAPAIKVVKIGTSSWMVEDLKVTKFNNGDAIELAKTDAEWAAFGKSKKGCYRILKNGAYIYNGYVVNDARGIAPDSMKIPSANDFKQIIKTFGSADKAFSAISSYKYEEGDIETVVHKADNKSGFTATKGGFSYGAGNVGDGNCTFWWTNSIEKGNSDTKLDVFSIGSCSQDLGNGQAPYSLDYGFSVRCIKK